MVFIVYNWAMAAIAMLNYQKANGWDLWIRQPYDTTGFDPKWVAKREYIMVENGSGWLCIWISWEVIIYKWLYSGWM